MASLAEQDFVLLGDKDMEGFNTAGLLPQLPVDIEKIQRWLQPTDFASDSSEFRKHSASYVEGTGLWIQKTEQFQQWRTSSNGVLWIKAVPGAGKSVVAARLASQLAEEEKVPVLHFFFRQIITTNRTAQSLVRDWMSQLLPYSPVLQFNLKELLKNNRNLESVSFDELWSNLVAAICTLPCVYCVADALDEMDMGNENFMQQLIELGNLSPSSVKVLMTSRPLPRIEKVLNKSTVLQLYLKLPFIGQDIGTYVQNRLYATILPDATKIKIEDTVRNKSEGLFLYARLMMDDLLGSKMLQTDRINDALFDLPTGLAEMYNNMLLEHSTRSGVPQELQALILQCVTHSSRPLRLLEIASVVDFVRRTTMPNLAVHAAGVPQDTKSIVRAGCGPLLEVLEDETVSILHHSLTEFLVDCNRSTEGENQFPQIGYATTHRAFGVVCIDYLSSEWFNDWVISNDRLPNNAPGMVRMKYPFLDYAINNWSYHLCEFDTDDEGINLKLDELLLPDSKCFLSCLNLMGMDSRPGKILPLHVSASKGLDHYIPHLIALGQDINRTDADKRTPLHRAAENGFHKVVKVLLEHGAANDPDDHHGLKPIHIAASRNHSVCVKLLLDSGVAPFTPKSKEDPGNWCGNAPRTYGKTAVEYACSYGHTETVRVFIPFLDSDGLRRALYWATTCGKTEAALSILEIPTIDVNKPIEGKTFIHLAAHAHDLKLMRRLLHLGADVSIKSNSVFGKHGIRGIGAEDKLEFSPLHAFAGSRRSGLINSIPETLRGFRLLLDAGCDISSYNGFGQTVFQTLLTGGEAFDESGCSTEVLEFLLANGADPLAPTQDGAHPMHLIRKDAEGVIDLLVAHGGDVNAQSLADGRTPLFHALSTYRDINLQALLKHGADVNVRDNNGDTPLHIAINGSNVGSKSKIEALLSRGADPNAQNKKGESPLHSLCIYGPSGDGLSLLLEAKADLELRTDEGFTVLLNAVKDNARMETVKALLQAGARADARDLSGRTVLHISCARVQRTDHANLIHMLVEAGADPAASDFAGNTLFHQLARQERSYYQQEQLALLETVLELGVSPLARNHEGRTPMHIAAGMKQSTMTMYKTDPYEFLLGPKCSLNINGSDYEGVRPIQ